MAAPTLIYCGGGNRQFMKLALGAGFEPGAQLPNTIYSPYLYFADQDWKAPARQRYMGALGMYRPKMATVLDWEHEHQLPIVLDWAEETAQYTDLVLIIPKVSGRINAIPRRIGGAEVVLAYSVPTKYGWSPVLPYELAGWPVHLLGGSPHQQMLLWRQMPYCQIVSADGNGYQRKATKYCEHWEPPGRWVPDGDREISGGPARAFARSVANIAEAWAELA
jgi:hypothetical protein